MEVHVGATLVGGPVTSFSFSAFSRREEESVFSFSLPLVILAWTALPVPSAVSNFTAKGATAVILEGGIRSWDYLEGGCTLEGDGALSGAVLVGGDTLGVSVLFFPRAFDFWTFGLPVLGIFRADCSNWSPVVPTHLHLLTAILYLQFLHYHSFGFSKGKFSFLHGDGQGYPVEVESFAVVRQGLVHLLLQVPRDKPLAFS